MTRANTAITSFNAGEVSPLIAQRPDLQKYQAGLSKCENFIPRVQGALTRRGGTRFVQAVKTSGQRTWFMPFEYSRQDAFMLEFGNTYIRFYKDRGVLELTTTPTAWSSGTAYAVADLVSLAGVNYYCKAAHTNHTPPNVTYWHPLTGTTYEIPSAWATSKLVKADGSFALGFVQSGDVLYITHPEVQTRKLTRTDDLIWKLELFEPDGGPFQDMNETQTITVQASAYAVGDETIITASSGIFEAGHVGALFYIQMQDGSNIKPWEVYQPVAVDDVRRSDGKYYKCTQVGEQPTYFTGTEKPIHTEGKYWDGDGKDVDDDSKGALGAEWEFLHAGYGWLKITSYVSATVVHGTVLSRLPNEVQTAATWRWALPSWSDVDGWPNAVCFFRERLTFARGQRTFHSQAGDFANFKAKDFGEQLPSSAFQVLVQSGKGDTIQWLAPTDHLLVGTGGSVHAIAEAASAQAFGPSNAAQKDQNMPQANGAAPVIPGPVLYADGPGRILNEISYSAEGSKYEAEDLNVYAEHVTLSGVTSMAFAKTPHAVVWCARADGGLAGLTYHKAQGVVGWHRHPIGGSGIVEHVAVIPSPDGDRDDLWLIVRRTINGSTKRYVEYITPEYLPGDDQALSGYSDCHLIYSGASTSTLSGLDHLEGCTVQVKADGSAHADCTVSSGSITLDRACTKAVVGLQADAKVMLLPIQAGAQLGTAQSQVKRIHTVWLSLLDSLGGKCGRNFTNTDTLTYRGVTDDMDAPPPLLADDAVRVEFEGDYERRATIAILCDQGFPFTLAALVAELMTNEG